mmetsp:Transcript_30892/g.56196  ORF Transcript_30892/g.56196 Transcript_30892/m.56196 type:complete len:306 (+) Transcript_30892:290-1207(+)
MRVHMASRFTILCRSCELVQPNFLVVCGRDGMHLVHARAEPPEALQAAHAHQVHAAGAADAAHLRSRVLAGAAQPESRGAVQDPARGLRGVCDLQLLAVPARLLGGRGAFGPEAALEAPAGPRQQRPEALLPLFLDPGAVAARGPVRAADLGGDAAVRARVASGDGAQLGRVVEGRVPRRRVGVWGDVHVLRPHHQLVAGVGHVLLGLVLPCAPRRAEADQAVRQVSVGEAGGVFHVLAVFRDWDLAAARGPRRRAGRHGVLHRARRLDQRRPQRLQRGRRWRRGGLCGAGAGQSRGWDERAAGG